MNISAVIDELVHLRNVIGDAEVKVADSVCGERQFNRIVGVNVGVSADSSKVVALDHVCATIDLIRKK